MYIVEVWRMVNVGQFFSDAIYAVMVLLHKVQPLKMDSLEYVDIGKNCLGRKYAHGLS